jgi:hypothetical protein
MKTFFRSLFVNVVGFAGVGLIVYGVSMWSIPSAFVVAGAFLAACALVSAVERPQPT